MSKPLYEITGQYLKLLEMLDDESIDDQIVRDTLSAIDGEMEEKADNYAKITKNLDGDIDALKNECKRLTARIKTLENRRDTLKENLKNSMLATGKIKFRTTLFSFSVAKNGGKAPVAITGDVPAFFLKPGEPDKEKIREALETGIELDFAEIAPRGESLRIR